MKKILLLSTVTAISLFATNGSNLIGLGAESRALGGTGIAHFSGAENALTNPALLGKTKSNVEFSFGGTIFDASVKVHTTAGNTNNPTTGGDKTSAQDKSMIPVVALSNRINENLVFGLGMYGTAGMGTDWRGDDVNAAVGKVGLYNMRSSLMLMQFAPSLAYHKDNFGLGMSAIMQYGQLSIDYDTAQGPTEPNPGVLKHVGNGPSQDYGYGYQIGGFYNINNSISLGAVYKSSIDMEYKDQISKAALAFGYGSHQAALAPKSDHLEQPAEIGIGLSFNIDNISYTVDYKTVKWGSAKGYKDFGWENQNVIALGGKYKVKNYWLGLGYNSTKNPIKNNTTTTSVAGGANTDGDTMNLFNHAMFPATIEKAYTFGGGYDLNNNSSLSFAFMLAPKVSTTRKAATVGVGNITTEHSQTATTIAYKFNF